MIQKENEQPFKEIDHQDIYELYDAWEQLHSWEEVLPVLEHFFESEERPTDQQQIARKYYACSRVFMMFYLDFRHSMKKMEKQLLELREIQRG